MANELGGAGPDETPTRPAPAPGFNKGADASPSTQGLPRLGNDLPGDTAPTIPLLPARPPMPHLGPLSPQERGIAPPRGLIGMSRNVRLTLIGLSVLLLVACCTLSWGAVSALFPPPGLPVAAASTAASGSPSAGASGTAIDQSSAAPGDSSTPTATGGDASPTPGASPTDTPTSSPPSPSPSANPCANPYCNPWGYNFTPGTVIYSPPYPQFCSVFPCIGKSSNNYAAFWNQTGYVVQCQDGLFAKNGNPELVGTCGKYGGYLRTLYQHP